MNNPKHTQGGWGRNIAPVSKYPIIYAGRNTHIARIITDGIPPDEAEANADLISAAPELLAALKATQRFPWVHNAAHTNDIEALRAIAMAYSQWNNDILLPALDRAERNREPAA